MPKIHLKPNSPEFEDFKARPKDRACDMPGCDRVGEFRAPKDRSLNEYYHFCQEHTAEYNKAWNYFSDMSPEEMQSHLKESIYGHRPTWKYGVGAEFVDELYRKAWQTFTYSDDPPPQGERYRKTSEQFIREHSPEVEAMEVMELMPPLTLDGIKKKYKELAKRYHPDLNNNDKAAEEKLKSVNMAYTILKMAYQKYEKLDVGT